MSTSAIPQPESQNALPQPTADPAVAAYYAGLAGQQQTIRQNLAVAAGDDPDQAGEAQRLAGRFGVGPQLVERNLPEFHRQANLEDALAGVAVSSSPILRQQLQNPNFAAIAHDQIDNLSATEKIFNSVSNHVSDIENQYEAGHLQYERGVLGDAAKLGRATPEDWTRIRAIDQRLKELGPQKTFLGGLSNMAGSLVPQGGYVAVGAGVGAVIGGGLGLFGGPFSEVTVPGGAVEGAKAGAEIMFGERAYTTAGGNAYLDMLDKGVHPDTAKWASAGVGLVNAALQVGGATLAGKMPGVTALSDAAREAIGKAAGMEIADAMTQPTVNRAVKSTIGRVLASSMEGGGLMAGQELVNQLALNAAELKDTDKFDLETEDGRAAAGKAIGQAFVNGALTIGSLHMATSMLAFGADMGRVRNAQDAQQFFTALHDNASDSKVRERNPASYEAYVAAQAQGTPAETIYVDGKQMANVLAQSGLPPERLEQAMPGLAQRVNEAAATGADVEIPTAEYAARLAGTDVGKAMLPHMRLDPDALSAQEAGEFAKEAQAKFDEARKTAAEQMTANEAFAASAKNVESDIFSQLKATKVLPDYAARTNAQFVRDFVVTQAARANMMPEDFYNRYKYTIQAAADGSRGGALHQMMNVESPEFKKWFGSSSVVDDEGKPLVAYHGTRSDFDAFDLDKSGAVAGSKAQRALFFSTEPETANAYARIAGALGEGDGADETGTKVMPVYLRVENPYVSKLERYNTEDFEREIAKAKKAGHDGVVFPGVKHGHESGQIAVFDPTQVKSAIGNRGTFDVNDASILHQGEEGTRGGFDPSTLTTLLGKKADMSTFLHETAHYFLSVYADLAKQADAPPEVKADMDALLKWFGVKDLDAWSGMSLDEQRRFHEQFAYSFEKYLADGKAPSKETEGMFIRFAQWLKRTYVSVRDDVNTIYRREHGEDLPILTGEVRTVMDRMLASDAQIRNREAVESMVPMFKSAEEAGMNSDQWAAYQAMGQEATEQGANELSAASIRQMQWLSNARGKLLKEMQKKHAALRAGVREQVAGEVASTDLRRAQRFLKSGELRGENGEEIQALVGHKLDSENVKAMFANALGETPDLGKLRGMMTKDGTDPEILAPMFGFASGEQMVRAIADAPSMDAEIDAKTDQRMLAEHGDMNTPEEQEAAIRRALHNAARARFVAVELRHLEKSTRPVREMLDAARRVAQQMLAEKKIGDIHPRDYAAAEARAARAVTDAMKRGDSAAVVRAKREQVLQNTLTREAQKARDEADEQLTYLSKFANPTKAMATAVGADFMDRINELVAGYQLGAREARGSDTRPLSAWVNDQYDKNGVMPAVRDEVMANLGRMHWKDMTPGQLSDLHDAVKSLYYIGKRAQTVLIEGKERQLADVRAELKATLAELPHTKNPDIRADLVHAHGKAKISARFLDKRNTLKSADAALLKMEQLLQWFDLGRDAGLKEASINGPWQRYIFKRASEAEGVERGLKANSAKAIRALNAEMRRAGPVTDDVLDVPEMPRGDKGRSTQWYREELLSAVLNMGNWSNKYKMLKYYGWSEQAVMSAIDRVLSKPELDYIQGVWDHIGSYGQQIVELKRRETGIMPKMIETEALKTKWGIYRGGYYPMDYDVFYDHSIEDKQARSADRLFENNYATPTTNDGFTTERTGYVGPINFSLSVIAKHLDEVTHNLAWREAIIDMNKIVSDPALKNEINQTWGRPYSAMFRPWLQAMANNRVFDTTGQSFWDRALRQIRSHGTIVGIGFRGTTILTHGSTAAANSIGEIGHKWFLKGLEQYTGIDRVRNSIQFTNERSPEMLHRRDEWDRNVHEATNEINRRQLDLRSPASAIQLFDKASKFAFYGVSTSDMMSARVLWTGAYLKGMAKAADGGMDLSEDEAIAYADRAVRNGHGGGGIKDLSAIQRSNGPMSMLTMFYSYWNHVYQRQRDIGMGWRKVMGAPLEHIHDMPRLLARSWYYVVLGSMMHAFWSTAPRGKEDQDETSEALAARISEEIGLGLVGGIPGIRDLANAAFVQRREYHLTPLDQAGQAFVTTARNAIHLTEGEPLTKNAYTTGAAAAGYAFGLPLSQPAATTKFFWDYTNGDVDPETLREWYQGVLTGHIN